MVTLHEESAGYFWIISSSRCAVACPSTAAPVAMDCREKERLRRTWSIIDGYHGAEQSWWPSPLAAPPSQSKVHKERSELSATEDPLTSRTSDMAICRTTASAIDFCVSTGQPHSTAWRESHSDAFWMMAHFAAFMLVEGVPDFNGREGSSFANHTMIWRDFASFGGPAAEW